MALTSEVAKESGATVALPRDLGAGLAGLPTLA